MHEFGNKFRLSSKYQSSLRNTIHVASQTHGAKGPLTKVHMTNMNGADIVVHVAIVLSCCRQANSVLGVGQVHAEALGHKVVPTCACQ
jgi:hypothetical protein